MAQLIVRNVSLVLVQRLKTRAARNRRSAEAEHREILKHALEVRATFKDLLAGIPL